MSAFPLPGSASVYTAPERLKAVVGQIRDCDDVRYFRRRASAQRPCSACGRHPPSRRLFKILLRRTTAGVETIEIGPVCAARHLRRAVAAELRRVQAGTSPNKQAQIARLQRAIAILRRP